jgi:NTP pyrophosphatase (non-canonical NTP hydrolase)
LRRAEQLKENPTFNLYQELTGSTAVYPGRETFQGLCYCLFKLSGEVGEISEKMGKLLRDRGVGWDSNPRDWPQDILDAFKKELGDVQWYIAQTSHEFGFSLQDVAETNLEKLQSRQERGVVHGSGDNR